MDTSNTALANGLENMIFYEAGTPDKIKLVSAHYPGGTVTVQLYYMTAHNIKIYHPIKITQKPCLAQTVTKLGSVTAAQNLIVVDPDQKSPAFPSSDYRLDYIFQNTDNGKFLCPVTYTYEVLNKDSFTDDRKPLFKIVTATTKVTFDYKTSTQNLSLTPYDGKTIHYRVTAITAANLPLTTDFSVVPRT